MEKEKIRMLNDNLRVNFIGGRVLMTQGIQALKESTRHSIIEAVRDFEDFDLEANDPHQEHDFGTVEVDGEKAFFKIDYYDKSMVFASENPADPSITARVMTILLAHEY